MDICFFGNIYFRFFNDNLKIIGNLKIKQTLFVALMFIFIGLIALIYILFHKNEYNKLLQYENKSKILFLIILFGVLLIA